MAAVWPTSSGLTGSGPWNARVHIACVCVCVLVWHIPFTHGTCVRRHACAVAHVCKCALACLCMHVQCYSMYNVHTCVQMLQHTRTYASCMCVCAHSRAKHVSWPHGICAHAGLLQHVCVHTCPVCAHVCAPTTAHTLCIWGRGLCACGLNSFFCIFSLTSPLPLPVAPKMQHL